ncbi:MAG TPA: type II toxin-antitoxin system prevent-host-death family antitoxin [Gaiellaceae bacterium]|nr:type II toxin-antitoxin system prevent-host-death family antitoxin [Gaiellaceae bacterium]
MPTVPVRELRNRYGALLAAVAAGEEITITDQGRPVARLVAASGRRRLVPTAELKNALGDGSLDAERFLDDVRPPDASRVLGEL